MNKEQLKGLIKENYLYAYALNQTENDGIGVEKYVDQLADEILAGLKPDWGVVCKLYPTQIIGINDGHLVYTPSHSEMGFKKACITITEVKE